MSLRKKLSTATKWAYLKNGGKLPSTKKPDPVYVDSPNDPRYQAYQDSMALYNEGELAHGRMSYPNLTTWSSRKDPVVENSFWKDAMGKTDTIKLNPAYDRLYALNGVPPSNENNQVPIKVGFSKYKNEFIRSYYTRYNKPIQPVQVYKGQTEPLPNKQMDPLISKQSTVPSTNLSYQNLPTPFKSRVELTARNYGDLLARQGRGEKFLGKDISQMRMGRMDIGEGWEDMDAATYYEYAKDRPGSDNADFTRAYEREVLKKPKMKLGGNLPDQPSTGVTYGSPEYYKAYSQGKVGNAKVEDGQIYANMSLPEVTVTSDQDTAPVDLEKIDALLAQGKMPEATKIMQANSWSTNRMIAKQDAHLYGAKGPNATGAIYGEDDGRFSHGFVGDMATSLLNPISIVESTTKLPGALRASLRGYKDISMRKAVQRTRQNSSTPTPAPTEGIHDILRRSAVRIDPATQDQLGLTRATQRGSDIDIDAMLAAEREAMRNRTLDELQANFQQGDYIMDEDVISNTGWGGIISNGYNLSSNVGPSRIKNSFTTNESLRNAPTEHLLNAKGSSYSPSGLNKELALRIPKEPKRIIGVPLAKMYQTGKLNPKHMWYRGQKFMDGDSWGHAMFNMTPQEVSQATNNIIDGIPKGGQFRDKNLSTDSFRLLLPKAGAMKNEFDVITSGSFNPLNDFGRKGKELISIHGESKGNEEVIKLLNTYIDRFNRNTGKKVPHAKMVDNRVHVPDLIIQRKGGGIEKAFERNKNNLTMATAIPTAAAAGDVVGNTLMGTPEESIFIQLLNGAGEDNSPTAATGPKRTRVAKPKKNAK